MEEDELSDEELPPEEEEPPPVEEEDEPEEDIAILDPPPPAFPPPPGAGELTGETAGVLITIFGGINSVPLNFSSNCACKEIINPAFEP